MEVALGIIGVIIIIGCLISIVSNRIMDSSGFEVEIISSKDNPMLKVEAEMRQQIITYIAAIIGSTCNILPDEMDIDIISSVNNRNLVIINHDDFMWRVYCDWGRRIKIEFSYAPIQSPRDAVVKHKTFRIKDIFVDFSAMSKYISKWYYEILGDFHPIAIDSAIVAAAEVEHDSPKSEESLVNMLFDVWNNLRDAATMRNKKQKFIALQDFSKLTMFLLRFYPEQVYHELGGIGDFNNVTNATTDADTNITTTEETN